MVSHPESILTVFCLPPCSAEACKGGSGCLQLGFLKDRATSHSFWHPWYLVQGSGTQPTHHQCADLDLLVLVVL